MNPIGFRFLLVACSIISAASASDIPPEQMRAIYEEVKTPYRTALCSRRKRWIVRRSSGTGTAGTWSMSAREGRRVHDPVGRERGPAALAGQRHDSRAGSGGGLGQSQRGRRHRPRRYAVGRRGDS
jgi:hypothetical protein